MAEQADPFSLVYETLWTGIVEPANPAHREVLNATRQRVRFDKVIAPNALQEAWGDGQTPLVALLAGKQNIDLFAFDASAVRMVLSHQLVYVGRSLDVTMNNRLKWYTLRALHRLGPYVGLPRLVPDPVKVRSAGDDFGAVSQWAKGEARVVTIWSIDVPVLIDTAAVLSGSYPSTL
jgi:hypothetical protein